MENLYAKDTSQEQVIDAGDKAMGVDERRRVSWWIASHHKLNRFVFYRTRNNVLYIYLVYMKSLFPKPLTSTPTYYSFALLTSFCN